jgi:hypothetical protein
MRDLTLNCDEFLEPVQIVEKTSLKNGTQFKIRVQMWWKKKNPQKKFPF